VKSLEYDSGAFGTKYVESRRNLSKSEGEWSLPTAIAVNVHESVALRIVLAYPSECLPSSMFLC